MRASWVGEAPLPPLQSFRLLACPARKVLQASSDEKRRRLTKAKHSKEEETSQAGQNRATRARFCTHLNQSDKFAGPLLQARIQDEHPVHPAATVSKAKARKILIATPSQHDQQSVLAADFVNVSEQVASKQAQAGGVLDKRARSQNRKRVIEGSHIRSSCVRVGVRPPCHFG